MTIAWLDLAFTAMEAVAAYFLLEAFFMPRYAKHVTAVLFAVKYLVVFCLTHYVVKQNGPVKMLLVFGLAFMLEMVAYKGRVWKKLFFAVFLLLIFQIFDAVFMFGVRWGTGYSFEQILATPATLIPLGTGSKLLAILAGVLLYKVRRHLRGDTVLTWKSWGQMLLFPLCTLFTLLVFARAGAQVPQLMGAIAACTFGLVGANLAVLFLLEQVERERLTQKQNELLAQQTRLTMEAATALRDAYAGQRRLTHDFKNHLTALRALLRQGQPGEAEAYLDGIDPGRGAAPLVADTGSPAVDAVLSQKCMQAQAAEVALRLTVNELGALPLRDADLVVVLANLLDNAIEAAAQCAPGARTVQVRLVREQAQLVLAVRNTVARPVKIEGGRIATTKADREAHGFGLQNVQGVLARYGADYTLDCTGGWFIFTAVFDSLAQ